MKTPAKPCLLIVDDDNDVRAMLQMSLGDDYTVFCLPNGDVVLAQIDMARPSLLILDVNAPGSRGYEASEEVRQLRRCIEFLLNRGDHK